MASSTVEDYVKAVYVLQQESPTGEATVARIAATLGVTKGSVTAMVRKLCEANLADAERYSGIKLTRKGKALAVDIIRRHRLIEVFLAETLGLDWSEVHDEAERLEHAMSAKVLDRLDAFLGHPLTDPHGDPIPDARGRVKTDDAEPLAAFAQGDTGYIRRVQDQDPEFLRLAAEHGLRPGARFKVVQASESADSVTVQIARHTPISMSSEVAGQILATR
ncbi:MAG: metal-dependent transcriptional regulator [Planctomycetota bacterium]